MMGEASTAVLLKTDRRGRVRMPREKRAALAVELLRQQEAAC